MYAAELRVGEMYPDEPPLRFRFPKLSAPPLIFSCLKVFLQKKYVFRADTNAP
jgi:hypothetical protein